MDWWPGFLCLMFVGTCQGIFDASNGGLTYQTVEPNNQAVIKIIADETAYITWQHMELDSLIARYKNKTLILLGDRTYYSVSSEMKNGTVTVEMNITVDSKTMGNYLCTYNNNTETKKAYFYVGLNTTSSSVSLNVKKYTECCKSANVSSDCLPACDANKLDFQSFNFSLCASPKDIAALRHCLMDNKNHVGCCSQRKVQASCLALCSAKAKPTSTVECGEDLGSITQCLYEGKEAIPSPPASLVVQTPDRKSMQLIWSPPQLNFALLTGYQISYKAESEEHWRKITVSKTTLTKKITEDVKLNAKYSVFVQAISLHGTSYPSETVVVSMLSDFFYEKVQGVSISDCCAKKKVNSKCQAILCAGIPMKIEISDILACIKDWHSILECYTGGRNSSSCCLSNGLSKPCLKFCAGKTFDTHAKDFVCLAEAGVMTRCFDAGLRNVPSPPREFSASSVSFQSISWQWKPPANLGDPKSKMKYKLLYKNLYDAGFSPQSKIIGNVTSFKLTRLKPGSTYQAELFAFNEHGFSLGSNEVHVATHSSGPVVLPPQNPHNPVTCCKSELVPAECQALCDLKKKVVFPLPEKCEFTAGKIASCLADHRNHSHCCFNSHTIPSHCQFICRGQNVSALNSKSNLWSCMKDSSFAAVRSCFAAGLALLPSAPRSLELVDVQEKFAKIRWQAPDRYPQPLTGYELSIKEKDKLTSKIIDSKLLETTVPVKLNTNYLLRLYTITNGGKSLPSNSVAFRTPPKLSNDYLKNLRPNFGIDNVTTCCAKHDITANCQAMCNTHSNASYLWTASTVQQCAAKLKTVLECSSDGRDHSGCCFQRRVPTFCLDMCLGKLNTNQAKSLVCVQFLPEIRSCFLDGYETLPAAPHLQSARELSHSSVLLKFTLPESNSKVSKVDNYLYYKAKAAKFWQVKANIRSPFVLEGLSSFTTYSFFMVTSNENGTSLPSALHSVTTFQNSPFNLYILANPGFNVIDGTQNLRLSCVMSPMSEETSFTWFRDGEKLSTKRSELTYSHVTRANAGQHTCQASVSGRTVTRSVFLTVQYEISVTTSSKLLLTPLFRTVEVSCTFNGFPTSVYWIGANYRQIQPTNPTYLVTTTKNNHYTVSRLRITQVLQDSYGEYKCVGSNNFGDRNQSIFIKDPSFTGVIPTPSNSSSVADPKKCCANRHVSQTCQEACSFATNLTFFSSNAPCLPEMPSIISCLGDGRNHSVCCVDEGVPSPCLPLCSGQRPNMDDAVLQCFSAKLSDKMLKCMESGSKSLPSEPLSLKVLSKHKTSIVFSWKPPEKNAGNVISYTVQVLDMELQNTSLYNVEGRALQWTMTNLAPSRSFVVRVRAEGKRGSSHFSTRVTTYSLGPPMAPVNLHTELIKNVFLKLSWEMPHQSKVPSSKFKVVWKMKGAKKDGDGEEKTNFTTAREIIFPCLEENSHFVFQLVAVNSIGESPKSKKMFVNTKENISPHCAKKKIVKTNTKTELGSYVAVAVLLLLLLAGLLGVMVFIQINRHNPNYAWPGWLRRLPGLQSRGDPVSTYDFDNPVRFENFTENVRLEVDRSSEA